MVQCLIYVSQKIHRICWKPTASTIQKPDIFACGSYEETSNAVSLWDIDRMNSISLMSSDSEDVAMPQKLCSCAVDGDVNGMEFASDSSLVVGTSSGNVVLLKTEDKRSLHATMSWEGLHNPALGGCSDVSVNSSQFASFGEDGSIHVMDIKRKQPLKSMRQAHSTPITCGQFLNSHDICTCTTLGQVGIWDMRAPSTPARLMMSSNNLTELWSVDHHPSQSHILAAGGSDGLVTFFDVRNENSALEQLLIHSDDVWGVQFHKTTTNKLFTCCADGSVRALDTTDIIKSSSRNATDSGGMMKTVEADELLSPNNISANSIDASGNMLLCCNDAEAVYVIDSV